MLNWISICEWYEDSFLTFLSSLFELSTSLLFIFEIVDCDLPELLNYAYFFKL